jgi:hypothetical protein
MLVSTNDKGRLVTWISTHRPVPVLGFVVGGDYGRPAEYKAFACLYPGQPGLWMFNAIMPDQELRQRTAACELPTDADERQVKYVRTHMRGMGTSAQMREAAEGFAIKHELPLGCFAVGRTAAGSLKYMLWMNALLTPSEFLKELKRASQR